MDTSSDADSFNPFALMTSPELVFAALERSDRLARLKSTICRPLDKPRPEKPIVEVKAFDEEIEETTELPEALEAPGVLEAPGAPEAPLV